jgi:hypothetical protein
MVSFMIDSSIISESYFKSKKLYKLEFQIPPASEVWSLFDSDTVSDINKDIEEGLLESIDSLFKEGRFIMLFDWHRDEELCLDIEDAYLEFVNDKKPSKLLGQWRYVRSAREVTLEWDVPDWFVNSESQCIVDLDEIRNTVKDWFIYSE